MIGRTIRFMAWVKRGRGRLLRSRSSFEGRPLLDRTFSSGAGSRDVDATILNVTLIYAR
jgi:hypothetical protein